ncbi:MAG: cupin domain-containing protein [Deltaproteobacteria bacterium]|jgi:quercetin dioxygenase-like cupin family protein|nr:cupin domain-containing protein [Deltaproteobacteria bacterium]
MSDQLFPKGEPAAPDWFTGAAFVNMLFPDSSGLLDCQVYDVVFEPGARNKWHSHPGGQILLVTDGVGYYQEKGQPSKRLIKGDIVPIPPNVTHWHGAAPDNSFTHIGISPNTSKGAAAWFDEVNDEQYSQATGEAAIILTAGNWQL